MSVERYLVQKRHFLCFINWEFNWFVPFGPAGEMAASFMHTLYIITVQTKARHLLTRPAPPSFSAPREASPLSLQLDFAGMLDLGSGFPLTFPARLRGPLKFLGTNRVSVFHFFLSQPWGLGPISSLLSV